MAVQGSESVSPKSEHFIRQQMKKTLSVLKARLRTGTASVSVYLVVKVAIDSPDVRDQVHCE
jgi:hypothetical protein